MQSANRYLSNIELGDEVVEWQPPKGDKAHINEFFSRVAEAVEALMPDRGLTFIFTTNLESLPEYGPKVVVFSLSEENGLTPLYTDRVGAIFKCYGALPHFFNLPITDNPDLAVPSFARNAKVAAKWIVSYAKWRKAVANPQGRSKIHHFPLGYNAPLQPRVAFKERTWDVFFAGSIRHSLTGKKWRLKSPKEITRRQLLEALERLSRENPQIRIRLLTSNGYVPHSVAWGFTDPSAVFSEGQYMTEMGNSKICLSPRGTSAETFRHYEAAAMGCVVVSEELPHCDFYDAAPFVRVNHWQEIVHTIPKLLADGDRLEDIHRQTLGWWEKYGAAPALARRVAASLIGDGVVERFPLDTAVAQPLPAGV